MHLTLNIDTDFFTAMTDIIISIAVVGWIYVKIIAILLTVIGPIIEKYQLRP